MANNGLIPFINKGYEPKKYELVKNGDVILADASEDVPCCGNSVEVIWNEKIQIVSGLHTIHCRDIKDLTIPGYKGFYFLSKPMKDQLKRLVQGSKISSISSNNFHELLMAIPKKDTQRKIVAFLSKIEELIETQKKIIEDYSILIDWYIQQMFSDRGLFREGKIVRLCDILSPGSKVPVDTSLYRKITIKLNLRGISFFNGSREMSNTRPFYVRKQGEIIIGKQNYFNGSVAMVGAEFDNTICSNAIMSFLLSVDMDKDLLFFAISNKAFLDFHSYFANGTGQKELSEKDFLNFNIRIPSDEKQSIFSNRIVSIKHLKEKESFLLHDLEKIKAYLLSNLFI
jgi:type I restriction enzyme S subunit